MKRTTYLILVIDYNVMAILNLDIKMLLLPTHTYRISLEHVNNIIIFRIEGQVTNICSIWRLSRYFTWVKVPLPLCSRSSWQTTYIKRWRIRHVVWGCYKCLGRCLERTTERAERERERESKHTW